MIYTRLFGGAGNQMFQYAAGRALADHLGTDLVLDRRYMRLWDESRGDCFAHYAGTRFRDDVALPPSKFDGMLRYGMWRLFGRAPWFRREKGLGYDPTFFDTPDGAYLHGYWQSEKYFGASAARIREDFRLTSPLNSANREMAARIGEAEAAVSVHVRRGDYVADGGFAACPPGYYAKAVETLAEREGRPLTCFVFSNDPAWARDNLALGAETVVVDINPESAGHFDMHLQSLCAHNIIANSTFSWWGAWLGERSGKVVIAPKTWFAPGKPANPDICPESWLRL